MNMFEKQKGKDEGNPLASSCQRSRERTYYRLADMRSVEEPRETG